MVEPNVQVPTDVTPPAAPAPVEQTPPAAAPAQVTPEQLPTDTREKTREQFDKLLDSNRRLFEANELLRREMSQRTTAQQTYAPIQQTPQPVTQQVNEADFVETDPTTGEKFINTQRMTQRINEVNSRASKTEEAVKNYIKTSEQREIERQSRETFASYPELNPGTPTSLNPKFDQKFNKQVRGVLLDSMYNPNDYSGRPLSFKEAADFVKATTVGTQSSSAPAPTKKEKEAQAAAVAASKELKSQSSAQVPSQPQNAPQPVNDEELQRLRIKTRMGDSDALARRLINTEHIVPRQST
jgi:hypothetical protein